MAALSAMRNRKSQKLREGFEDFMARCVERSEERNEVELDFVLDIFENLDIKIKEKEVKTLEKIADRNRKISRWLIFINIKYLLVSIFC
jgi:predicted solute-binding protein